MEKGSFPIRFVFCKESSAKRSYRRRKGRKNKHVKFKGLSNRSRRNLQKSKKEKL